MRLSTEQLPQHLKRGLAPLYTVFGDEPLLALEAADRLRARARADGYGEREVLTAEQHFDWSQLRMSAQSQSLFASRRILELRIPSGKPGSEGSQALQDLCARLPTETITLVCLPGIDWRGQKAAWFAALDAAGAMVEAKQVARSALPAWIAERLKAQEQHAGEETLEFIAERVEGNLLAAYQEVQKLALLFPPGRLEFEQVREAVFDVARFDVFDLGAVLIAGDTQHLARVLDALQGEGAAPPLVLWALTEEIRAIARLLAALATGRPLQQAMREARVWGPARQNLMQRHIKRFTAQQAEAALVHAAGIDHMIKGLAKGDVWDELLQLGLRFASARPSAAKTR
ncbi:MAG: DNA polymerase III subunit delta [Betaproteobacteria bacterium]|nr:DNA polymerase III subunit delta [Betaproteobacteria bacterium]MBI2292237.1 DNA polymerase III subunit delta [Betaproteobacteria bacterium]